VAAYLVKTEPTEHLFADLVREGHTSWSGVARAPALVHVSSMRGGDLVAVYHCGRAKAVVCIAELARDPYRDPATTDSNRVVIDLLAKRTLSHPVTLAEFRDDPVLQACDLLRQPRLSVMPLTDAQLRRLLAASASPAGHDR